jgi:DNA-binding NarL/FixJ family response regulator
MNAETQAPAVGTPLPSSRPTLATFTLHSTQFQVLTVPLRHGSIPPDALTPAECEVAILAAAGMSNDAVAHARGTSVRTTANQMASILAKLGFGSRFELAGLPFATPNPDEIPESAAFARTALQRVALAAMQHAPSDVAQPDGAAPRFWQGLVEGRLRLIEHFESRQRRYYIASETSPEARAPGLDARERLLADIVGSGQSEKVAAYELGVGVGTASLLLKSTLAKLGLRSRVDLVVLFRASNGSPPSRLPRRPGMEQVAKGRK